MQLERTRIRTCRKQLYLNPILATELNFIASDEGRSFNDLVHLALEKYVTEMRKNV